MSANIYDWSITASSNDSADSGINWLEGQDPGTVNNSARAMMGRIAELLKDIGGTITAGGTADALTVTANSGFTTLANGRMVAFIAASDNTTAATLNVNGIGAKSIRKADSTGDIPLVGAEIQAGCVYVVQYNTALNGAAGGWSLLNPSLPTGLTNYPTSSTDNRVVRFDGTAGKIQTSGVTIDDSNNISGLGTISSGAITATSDITSPQNFIASTANIVLGPTGAGNVFLRPNGVGSSAGQVIIDASGNASMVGGINTLGNYGSISGAINLRPNGYASSSGQLNVASTGDVTVNGVLNVQGSSYSMTDAGPGMSLYNSDPIINVGRTSNVALQTKRRGTDGRAINTYKNETNVGGATVSAAATSWDTSSDERLKDFIGRYDPARAIAIIRADPVRDFRWNKYVPGAVGQYAVGWGAQTSYGVSQDLASPGHGNPGEPEFQPWGVDQGKRTPYLWAAQSWSLDRIDELLVRVAALEAKLAALGGSNQEQP